MCHKILKSCCKVEFIHNDDNTLNYRRHKPYTGNRYSRVQNSNPVIFFGSKKYRRCFLIDSRVLNPNFWVQPLGSVGNSR